MHQEGENCGNDGDDAGEVEIHILEVIDHPQFFLLIAPEAYKRDRIMCLNRQEVRWCPEGGPERRPFSVGEDYVAAAALFLVCNICGNIPIHCCNYTVTFCQTNSSISTSF